MSTAIITAPTCRFKTKRRGAHIGILINGTCGECLVDMRASLAALFTGGDTFCHECGAKPAEGDLLNYLYRDTGAIILCEPCRIKFAPKIVGEINAAATEKQALIIKSVNARAEVAREPNPYRRLTLWEQWRRIIGPRRRA